MGRKDRKEDTGGRREANERGGRKGEEWDMEGMKMSQNGLV